MRKFALVAAAAAMAVGGSMVKADFVVSHTRASNAFTIGSTSYDMVTWTVTNNEANGTGDNLASVDAALFDPVSGSGMVIGLNSANHPDVYGIGNEANKAAEDSFLAQQASGGSGAPGESVLIQTGSTYAADQEIGGHFSGTYTQQQLVSGIAGALLFLTPVDANPSDGFGAAITFAQIAVPHGDPVELLAPTARSSVGVPATWEPLATGFGEDPNDGTTGAFVPISATIVDGTLVPEPASFGLFGIAAAGLLSRRRRD